MGHPCGPDRTGIPYRGRFILGGGAIVDISACSIFEVSDDAPKVKGVVETTGGPGRFAAKKIGRATLTEGLNVVMIRPLRLRDSAGLMNLRKATLKPANP